MPLYDIEIECLIRKTYTVEGDCEQDATERAHESFSPRSEDGVEESYKEDLVRSSESSLPKEAYDAWVSFCQVAVENGALVEPWFDENFEAGASVADVLAWFETRFELPISMFLRIR